MIRFVELVRVSSQGQADRDTPEIQRRALDRLRSSRPGVPVERIEAPGVSGALPLSQRPDLQRLEQLAKARAFDELRVYAVDRLTRSDDLRERAAVLGMVMDAGAVIVDVGGRVIDPSDEIGEVDYYLQTMFAARERRRIVTRTMDGRRRAASEGRSGGGRTPYGVRYDRTSRTWSLFEPEAAVLRRIFEMACAGRSLGEIKDALNGDGVPTRFGNQWSRGTIGRLLRNRAAIGEHREMGYPVTVPAVVDAATFDLAAEQLRRNRSKTGPAAIYPAMMRRLMVCAECGYSVRVVVRGRGDERVPYYVCGAHESEFGQKCRPRARYQRVALVDAAIRAHVESFLRRPAVLRAAAGLGPRGGRPRDYDAEIEEASRELARLDAQEDRVVRLLRDDLVSEANARAQLAEIRSRRAAATTRCERATEEREAATASAVPLRAVEAQTAAIVARIESATENEWAELMAILFPRREPYGLKLGDGTVEGVGVLPLDDAGAAIVEEAASDLSRFASGARQTRQLPVAMPFRVRVRFDHRKRRPDELRARSRR